MRPHASTAHREDASRSTRNRKRLKYLKTSLHKAKATIRLLEATPAQDICLVEKTKKDVDMLTKKLSDIVEDILSLPEDDTASLNEATSMEDELGSLTLKLIKLTNDREKREHRTTDKASASPGVRLPKISIPTFDGKILSWRSFWEQFDATIHSKAGSNDIEKLTYLQDALKDSPARFYDKGIDSNVRELRGSHQELKGAIRSAKVSSGRTHPKYRGCGSSEERKRQGALRSLWCCNTAQSSAKGSKERLVRHSSYCDTPAEAGREDTAELGGV